MSVGWITVILVLIALLNVASNIVYLAAVTRDLFAFARDRGTSSAYIAIHVGTHLLTAALLP